MNIPEKTIGFSKKFLTDLLYLTRDPEIAKYHSILMNGIDALRKNHTQEEIDAMPLSVIFEQDNIYE